MTRRQATLVAGLDARRIHSRRHEHRQHGDFRRDHRLRSLRFHGRATIPATVFSSIDSHGRYAYGNQPAMAQWNMARFAETILALIDARHAARGGYCEPGGQLVPRAFRVILDRRACGARSGSLTSEQGDPALVGALLDLMQRAGADYTLTFRRLCDAAGERGRRRRGAPGRVAPGRARAVDRRMALAPRARPASDRRSRALDAHGQPGLYSAQSSRRGGDRRRDGAGGFRAVRRRCCKCCRGPTKSNRGREAYLAPPLPAERVLQTFCGT